MNALNNISQAPKKRGRPRSFDRDKLLQKVMMLYWSRGIDNVSVNEICKQCSVSKPGLYREFSSEDVLKEAVIDLYHQTILRNLEVMLSKKATFRDICEELIEFIGQDRSEACLPTGCLFVDSVHCKQKLGPLSLDKVHQVRTKMLTCYREWIERAKVSGELVPNILSQTGAIYIESQISNAMLQQRNATPNQDIKKMLTLAFSVFFRP